MKGQRARSFRLLIAEQAIETAISASRNAAPFETGGLLAGVETPDGLWVTDVIEIQTERRSRRAFVIPVRTTRARIDERRSVDARVGYIGDWHSHPQNLGASLLDLRTLGQLAVGSVGRRRIVVVVRRQGQAWCLDAWAQGGLRLPNRLPYELTGPLPG